MKSSKQKYHSVCSSRFSLLLCAVRKNHLNISIMKKITILMITLMFGICQTWSAPIDQSQARSIVRSFLTNPSSYNLMSRSTNGNSLQCVHAEMSTADVNKAAYYVFNTGAGYVIVAGDDRVDGLLACGDKDLNMGHLSCGMKSLLNWYKLEMDYLLSHPDLEVPGLMQRAPKAAVQSIAPMLTAQWGQSAPFNNECPVVGENHCLTGCPSTSLSMLMYYWKYPAGISTRLPAYTTYSGLSVEALPPTTFDWDNMLDSYLDGYTQEQGDAVAHLMRYVGQSEQMDYTLEASGAYVSDILATARAFGYDSGARILTKSLASGINMYDDQRWTSLLLNELQQRRPVVYTANAEDEGELCGHAFNVDGYDAELGMFHVNFGWEGEDNGYYMLNDFTGLDLTFNIYQQMVIGLQPGGYQLSFSVNPEVLSFNNVAVGEELTHTFTVNATDMTGDLLLTLDDPDGVFTIDKTRINASEANGGTEVAVTYAPEVVGTNSASVTISGSGVEEQTIALNGFAHVHGDTDPTITVGSTSLNFGNAYNGYGEVRTLMVSGQNLMDNLTLTIEDDPYHEYSTSTYSITPEQAAEGVEVRVRLFPTTEGMVRANLVLSSPGADDVVVSLSGRGIKTSAFIIVDEDTVTMRADNNFVALKRLKVVYKRFDGWLASPRIDSIGEVSQAAGGGDFIFLNAPFTATIIGNDSFSVMDARVVSTDGVIDTCTVQIAFNPSTLPPYTAQLELKSAVAHPVYVTLVGESSGTVLVDPVMLEPDPDEVTSSSFVARWLHNPKSLTVAGYLLECDNSGAFDEESDETQMVEIDSSEDWYEFDGLQPGETYYYRVIAYYDDGTFSEWSNVQSVTLPMRGDINGDGVLSISDVIQLIQLCLDDDASNNRNCDVNNDGVYNISDILALINIVLNDK